MEQMEGGWTSVGDKRVCALCFDDYAISEFINTRGDHGKCSYCTRRRPCVEMDVCLRFIAKGIQRGFEDPANGVGFCSAEGGYDISPTDGYDLVYSLLEGCNDDLMVDLQQAFAWSHYVKIDPYGPRELDALSYAWGEFSEQVKHRTRFLFQNSVEKNFDGTELGHSRPFEILRSVGDIVSQLELVTTLEPGAVIYRARQHAEPRLKGANQFGPPPPESARQNRMSPAGISRFYGASNPTLAVEETVDMNDTDSPYVSVAKFTVNRTLRVLDLSSLPRIPSIFDEVEASMIDKIAFLHDFSSSVIKPIARDGKEHFEYVPTQIVAEYFQHIFRFGRSCALDGIAFSSSRDGSGTCFTLFVDDEEFAEKPLMDLVFIKRRLVQF